MFSFQVPEECDECLADLSQTNAIRVLASQRLTNRNEYGEVADPAVNDASLILDDPSPLFVCVSCGCDLEVTATNED